MRPTAIVPIRTGPTVKRRLAHVLGPDERRALVQTMFDHVVDVLRDCDVRVVALSPKALASDRTVETWTDAAPGLNGALDAAVGRAGVPVLIVHADLPELSVEDVHAVLDNDADVVVARARDGGTNALLMRTRIRCAFGASSALAHAARARAAGLRASVIDRPGLALDVDDEAALTASRQRHALGTRPPA
jgi:2-phospho-L-lactate/phosphoenolpyruvate guanylyltransferase